VHTEQYDPWQLSWNCCQPPYTADQSIWVAAMREAFNATLRAEIRPPSAVYSGACYHHCFTQEAQFNTVTINGISMQQALGDWYFGRVAPYNLIDNCAGFNCSTGCPASPY